jgi:predicted DsbA family dithiol-disulfide isomerase
MHDRLFASQRAIEPLKGHAEALGLDVVAFESCIASEKNAEAVRKDMAQAQKAGGDWDP